MKDNIINILEKNEFILIVFLIKMLRKTRSFVNNNHVRYAIRNNVLPRLYKDMSKKGEGH